MYFYYQKNFSGEWTPRISADYPGKKVEGPTPERRGVRKLEERDLGLSLHRLSLRYPLEPEQQQQAESATEAGEECPSPSHPVPYLEKGEDSDRRLPLEELKERWADAMMKVPMNSEWEHANGGVYTAVGCALREGDCIPLILYHKGDGILWARPLQDFLSRFSALP